MIEIIAVLLTLWCVFLTIKVNIWCWPVGIASSIVYLYVFFVQHLYVGSLVEIIFILQGIYGWYYWNQHREPPTFKVGPLDFIVHLICAALLSIGLTVLLLDTNNPQPFLDSFTTILALLAGWYLSIKNTWAWPAFLIGNIFFVLMFIKQGMWPSAGLYTFLSFLALKGLSQWSRNIKTA